MDSPRSDNSATSAEPFHAWFSEKVQPHDAPLRAYLRGAFPTVRDVDDVVQESYLRVWQAYARGSVSSARRFLFRVARNLVLDGLRREHRSPFVQLGDLASLHVVDDKPSVTDAAESSERLALLDEALTALPARQRQVVILCKLQSKSHREVAELLGLSEKTVAEHVYRGVQRLGEELQKRGVQRFHR